jgi:putative ABC transport system permease protein
MDALVRNIRVGIRQLWKQPIFTASVLLTLGLAIAANATIFSFVSALLIRPFPFRDSDQLVQIRSMRGGQLGLMSMREVLDIKERVSVIEGIAAHTSGFGGYNYSGEGRPEEWKTILTTGNLFDVLGTPLVCGNKWPEHADRERDYRVILSHAVWKDTFGEQRDVVGKKITLDHAAGYEIHGVAPESFDYPQGVQVYRSLGGFAMYDQRTYRNVVAVARVRRPNSIDRLQSELDVLSRQLATEYPQTNEGLSFHAVSFRELYSGNVRSYLLLLLGAVGFVLLIACANVTNLQLSRALSRSREMGIRVALGARNSSLIAQMLVEGAVLAIVAGLFGFGMAWWWVKLLRAMIGIGLPEWMVIHIDGRVLAFTALVSVLATLISGAAPAVNATRLSVVESLRGSGRSASGGKDTTRLRDCLVAVEIAVAVILFVGAALLIRGFVELQNREKGFRSDSILTFRVALGWKRYIDQPSIARYYERALQELSRMPGFDAVAFASIPPLTSQEESAPNSVQYEGQSLQESLANPYVTRESISENYFSLTGISLLAGRPFNQFDGKDSEPVAIVSARLARTLWGNRDPVGRRLRHNPTAKTPGPFRKVIGVVADVQDHELGGQPGFHFYVPYRQEAEPNQYILVKSSLSMRDFTHIAERAMWSIDPEQSIFDFSTYDQRILNTVWQLRISRMLLILFSGVALVLAAIGIYSVTAYIAGQRQREVGIRMALGSSPGAIRVLIAKRSALTSLAGLATGLLGAAILGRVLEHALPGVTVTDPLAFVGVVLLLFVITLAASAFPAWRASRMDPVVSLRAE